jgi:hypothetical protein
MAAAFGADWAGVVRNQLVGQRVRLFAKASR